MTYKSINKDYFALVLFLCPCPLPHVLVPSPVFFLHLDAALAALRQALGEHGRGAGGHHLPAHHLGDSFSIRLLPKSPLQNHRGARGSVLTPTHCRAANPLRRRRLDHQPGHRHRPTVAPHQKAAGRRRRPHQRRARPDLSLARQPPPRAPHAPRGGHRPRRRRCSLIHSFPYGNCKEKELEIGDWNGLRLWRIFRRR